jgi:hypothetical protein
MADVKKRKQPQAPPPKVVESESESESESQDEEEEEEERAQAPANDDDDEDEEEEEEEEEVKPPPKKAKAVASKAEPSENGYTDIELTCKDCSETFIFEAGQQGTVYLIQCHTVSSVFNNVCVFLPSPVRRVLCIQGI